MQKNASHSQIHCICQYVNAKVLRKKLKKRKKKKQQCFYLMFVSMKPTYYYFRGKNKSYFLNVALVDPMH